MRLVVHLCSSMLDYATLNFTFQGSQERRKAYLNSTSDGFPVPMDSYTVVQTSSQGG